MKYKLHDNKDINRTLNHVVEQITKLTDKQLAHIQNLTRIGESLSSVSSINHIFDLILDEAVAFTNADAATIYRVSDDEKYLDFVVVFNKSLIIRMGGTSGKITWPSIALYDAKGKPRLKHIVANVYHKNRLLCFEDVYNLENYDISGTKEIDKSNNYRSKSMLTIPLTNHENEVLGVIQIINAMDRPGNIIPFDNEHIVMMKSLASMAAIAMSNRKLINDLETLIMQFMHSIAKGIERKSKYSSAHITRVSQLADMIAKKINEVNTGKFKDVHFQLNEIKEISMAGLMHDVGKIVTPEYIINKSTKLETILDRIELVGLRFELFKKALSLFKSQYGEPALLNLAGEWYPGKKFNNFADLIYLINEDKRFLEQVNIGVEFLSDKHFERIRQIGDIVLEYDNEVWRLLSDNEINTLQVRRGTLTPEEKTIMNDHVLVTWEMLSQLSFPKKYRNVALYAASHHEKLNGKGHPFGLKSEQLPLQSRILAIADIFEALTASNRPYNKIKKLSESIKILAFCAKDNEIDADILDFLLDSGLYLEYANEFIHKDQIDKIDIKAIKKIYHPELSDK